MLNLRLPASEKGEALSLEYRLVRSDRRTVSLEILPDGTAVVRAPKGLSRAKIDRFVVEKAEWIDRKRRLLAERGKNIPDGPFGPGSELPFLGERLLAAADPSLVRAERRGPVLALPAEDLEDAAREWLRGEARSFLPMRVRLLSEETGLRCKGVRITGARTRWGSCSAGNSLNFSFRLMLCTPEAADYVVLHELCHTVHHNHSAGFWALVERVCPDYRERRDWLYAHQDLMRLF